MTVAYDDATRELALRAIASESGNARGAVRLLARHGVKVSRATLDRWRTAHADRYEQIRDIELKKVQAESAEQHRRIERLELDGARQAAERLVKEIPDMTHKDLTNVLGKMDIGTGIHAEKAQLLAGEPTHRVARSLAEVARELAAEGIHFVEGEVVGEEDVTEIAAEAVAQIDAEEVPLSYEAIATEGP